MTIKALIGRIMKCVKEQGWNKMGFVPPVKQEINISGPIEDLILRNAWPRSNEVIVSRLFLISINRSSMNVIMAVIRMTRFLPYAISRYRDEGIMGIVDSSTSGRLLGMS